MGSQSWMWPIYFHFTLPHLCRVSSQKCSCLFYPFNSKRSFHLQILKSLREISKVYCISQVPTSTSQWLKIIKAYFLNKPYMFMEGWSWSSSQKPGYGTAFPAHRQLSMAKGKGSMPQLSEPFLRKSSEASSMALPEFTVGKWDFTR